MPIVFDSSIKRIILDTNYVTATEIYSRSCDWLAQGDNAKYGAVFRQVGADDLGGGLSIPPYYFLQGAWRVRPMESDHDLTIEGNIFVEGGGTPVVRTLGQYQVNARYVVPVQAQTVSTGGSGGTATVDVASIWAYANRSLTTAPPSNAPTADENAAAVWASSTRSLTTPFPAIPVAPTAVENAQAVWNSIVESGMSAAELLRLVTAFVAGDASNLSSGNPVFKSLDGSKARIAGTYENGYRTITTRDGT